MTSCGVIGNDVPQRVVRVKALADPAFRERNPRWNDEVRGLIEASSDYFENEFGVRFVTQSTAAWPAQEKIASTAGLMVRLKQEFSIDKKAENYDLLIAFTAERVNFYSGGRGRVDRIGDCREGLGSYVVVYVSAPFHYTGATTEPTIDVIALIHELGHIFGAEHVQDAQSIMNENFDYRSKFDIKNYNVILRNRLCPFAK
ncbi:MAG TPA: M12 family metallo-peptidase [Methylomirabilota bacterium]|nr:M12 family metallo-peptidase [Methylomirabilota bacterium]